LGDRYRLGERIANGGMGSVYRAVDESLGRPVAVKVLRRELADDPTFLERFRREARAAAAVSSPGVAGVYAHGLVHRDVKPGNVLIGPGGRAKVTDFGIAKAAASATLTRTGMVLGSANYVAPEQARGDDVGPAADQYSLGCVLFEAVTGRTPYDGATAVAIATQHVSAPVPDPRQDRPDLPVPAATLIRRALAKDPSARFPSATAMADALAAARAPGAPEPHPPIPGPQTPGAPEPHPPIPGPQTPGAPEPHRVIPGPPNREGSPTGDAAAAVVHTPHPVGRPPRIQPVVHSPRRPRRRGWRWRRSS
jgi:serine/threonine protein kinase